MPASQTLWRLKRHVFLNSKWMDSDEFSTLVQFRALWPAIRTRASHRRRRRDKRKSITKSMTSSSKASRLKQDIEEGETPSNGFQPTNLRRPPCPAPPLYPPDLEPEFELFIEPNVNRRRNGILAKYSPRQGTPQPQTSSILSKPPSTKASTLVGIGDGEAAASEDFEFSNAKSLKLNADGSGAADYDESADRREDAERALLHRIQDAMDVDEEDFEEVEEVVDDEDVDGMFAFDNDEEPKKKVVKKVKKSKPANMLPEGGVGLDAADDPEGYYTPTLGGTLDGKYHVFSAIGKGMFAVVLKARVVVTEDGTLLPDAAPKREVAIKIMRSQETMYKSGQREAALLAKLNAADPDDKRHVVRLERIFEWRSHFCIVMEGLGWNLREILKRFGKDVGLSIAAVKAYAIQIFLALSLFKKESITTADIKPDNILISNNNTTLKVCDLGSAADTSSGESTPTPYRAPEIILGLLSRYLVCGVYPVRTLHRPYPFPRPNQSSYAPAKFGAEYFDDLGAFFIDSSIGGDGTKLFSSKAERDVKTSLLGGSGGETKEVRDLVDLIEKCLVLDSGRRITPKEALEHPFLKR
ncbi:kinase-like protein [Flagelloscypha sp. PMI_526]|nr:kinase-like protein [Flagelloscypha sp. PMI_526]